MHYVLLVGDSEVMPVRYIVLDRVEPAAFNYSFYPCDLYYADVAKTDGSLRQLAQNPSQNCSTLHTPEGHAGSFDPA